MANQVDYKNAYFTMLRASEQAIRSLEAMQHGTAKIMLELIKAQQTAEELVISQELPDEDHENG